MPLFVQELLRWPFAHLPNPILCGLLSLLTSIATLAWVRVALMDCQMEPRRTPLIYAALGAGLGYLFSYLMFTSQPQATAEVIPSELWRDLRVPYQLTLIVGLLAATATDFRDFYISNRILWVGMAIGLAGAVISGDLQMAHVWVDWNQEVPQLRGPYLPAWMSRHPHVHGLAWSLAGIGAGMAISASVAWLAKLVLGRPALGSGDVFLMGMIGAYLGWQPTLIAFMLAPLLALTVGATAKLALNRPALPYGPFLSLGAIAVMFCWRRIWMLEITLAPAASATEREGVFSLRRFFGDPIAMLLISAIGLIAFFIMLGLTRLYQSIPTGRTELHRTLRGQSDESPEGR